ncbi:MAG: hypothetical protein ABIQ65_12250 [Thermoanaerobaculia bacterium]
MKRYTGQGSDEDMQRILVNPRDILLTNYVMLELILTRPQEKQLVERAQSLRFATLVLAVHRDDEPATRNRVSLPDARDEGTTVRNRFLHLRFQGS